MHYELFVTLIDKHFFLKDNLNMALTVKFVHKNTPAQKAGVKIGDKVHKVDDIEMNDFIDETFVRSLENPTLIIERQKKRKTLELEKEPYEDIGIEYKEELYPDEVECINGCLFCFVDQLPPNMRKSLYVRDDDWRYSVLYGNYVTMTNMSDEDFNRIVTRKVSPLYVSVHATDADVRMNLMRNKKAVKINEQLKFLYDNKITFHSQIVLCPGINDGEVMKKTIEDLAKLHPYAKTLSIVPVGLTGHRDNLPELTHVDKDTACKVISIIEAYRKKYKNEFGNPFVYASDEFYSKAGMEFPRYEVGEINAQKANGAGLFSDFLDEFEYAVDEINITEVEPRKVIITTGASAYAKINECAGLLCKKVKNLNIETVKVTNKHFGESITVAGLLTGCDIIEAVANKKADVLFVPESSLRDGENVFLDGMSLAELERKAKMNVEISPNDGYEFVKAMVGGKFE